MPVGNTMREMCQTRRTRERGLAWSVRRWRAATLIARTALVMVILAACAGGGGGTVSTIGTPGAGGANATSTAGGTTTVAVDTATPTPISGQGAQFGSSQFCSQKPSVSVQLPASIPAYSNAQLRLSQASGANSIYGLCTTATVTAAIQFYSDQLPGKGWQQLHLNANDPVQQLTAKQSGTNVTITIYPDAVISNETDIIIQLTAA